MALLDPRKASKNMRYDWAEMRWRGDICSGGAALAWLQVGGQRDFFAPAAAQALEGRRTSLEGLDPIGRHRYDDEWIRDIPANGVLADCGTTGLRTKVCAKYRGQPVDPSCHRGLRRCGASGRHHRPARRRST